MKMFWRKIKAFFFGKKNKEESVVFEIEDYVIKGYGLSIWGLDDSEDIVLRKNPDLAELKTGDYVLCKSPLKCAQCRDDKTLMRFIGLFDIRPADVEDCIKEVEKYSDRDDMFVHMPDKAGLFRWEKFINRYYKELPGMGIRLWEHMCLDYEKSYFEDKKYKNTDYHKIAVVCVKFGLNPVNYYMIPGEWIESVKI